MGKIARKLFATYLEAQTPTPSYSLLGTDLEDFSIEMNANVVKTANILGENSISVDKYEKQASIEPYKADNGNDLFTWLKSIIDGDLTLDNLNTNVVHVDLFGAESSGAYPAIKETCVVEVVSYGGDTEGFQIPFNIHLTGVKIAGTFNPATKVFTATTNPEYLATFSVTGTASARIANAKVVINNKIIYTDANGIANIKLVAGTYDYTVIATGYTNGTGSAIVTNAAVYTAVALTI